MADAKRRGYGEDGIYFDHRGDCRDSVAGNTLTGGEIATLDQQ